MLHVRLDEKISYDQSQLHGPFVDEAGPRFRSVRAVCCDVFIYESQRLRLFTDRTVIPILKPIQQENSVLYRFGFIQSIKDIMSTSSTKIVLNENGIPPFENLPLRKGDPPYSAWGLYGDNDELGTLNRQTDEIIAAAAKSEIKTGKR